MTHFLTRLILCAAGALLPLSAAAQTSGTTLTAEDMRVLASDLLNAGRPSDAGEVLNALLDRDPDDAAALILGAQAALDQGQPAAAVDLAGRAYGNATDDTTRYVAARLAALGHATLQQDTRAQIWLRLARQAAPDAERAESVAQDYAFLRDRNPLSVQLQFGVLPSSNINNGSRSETVTIGPFVTVLSESAKPLSGLQFNAGANLRYRLSETPTSQVVAGFDVSTTTYALSQRSRDALQRDYDAAKFGREDLPRHGSDFAYTEASINLTERYILREGWLPTTLTQEVGRSWYGGDPYQIFAAVSASQGFLLSPNELLRVETFYRYNFADQPGRTDAFGNPVTYDDVANFGAVLGYTRALDNGNVANLNIARRISMSDNSQNDFGSWRFGAGLDLGQPVMNVRFGFAAQFEERRYDRTPFLAGIRRDRIVTGQVTAQVEGLEFYGFAPVASLAAGRTFSRAERFDTEFATFGIDLRSAF